MALKEYPRQYIAGDFNPGDIKQIETEFEKLEKRTINSKADLEQWLLETSELMSVLDEEGAKRYVDSTCYTEDEEIQKRFQEYIGEIEPKIKPHAFNILQMLAENQHANELDSGTYGNVLRRAKNRVEIFRKENIPLQTEGQKLNNDYQKVVGAAMVEFEGKEYTLPQMNKFLEVNERSRRETAYMGIWNRFLKDSDEYDRIYDELIKLRTQMAKNAGFETYRELRFRELERFDYGTKESVEFQDAIAEIVVPLVDEIHENRKELLGVDTLRPWDLNVDPKNRKPLTPFENGKELAQKCRMAFDKVDTRLGSYFDVLIDNNLLDLDSRKGKAPGGYMCGFEERRVPFIFMNAAGVQRDVTTLLHEGGHAFHTIACRNHDIGMNRDYPIEFAEVASMSMELLAGTFLAVFYAEDEETKRARKNHLVGVITIIPWIATIDAFQHWIYTHPEHTHEERTKAWVEIYDRFRGNVVDMSGLDKHRENRWMRQLHLFGYPFYYIEYGIAQLGALQVWRNYKINPSKAVEDYLHGLSLGGSKPLPDLFNATGIKFDFSRGMLQELMDMVKEELDGMKDV